MATIDAVRRALGFLALSIVTVGVVLGFVFAGSPTTIAEGVHDRRRRRGRHEGGRRPRAARAGGRRSRLAGPSSSSPAGGASRFARSSSASSRTGRRRRRRRPAAGQRLRAAARLQAHRRRRLRRRRRRRRTTRARPARSSTSSTRIAAAVEPSAAGRRRSRCDGSNVVVVPARTGLAAGRGPPPQVPDRARALRSRPLAGAGTAADARRPSRACTCCSLAACRRARRASRSRLPSGSSSGKTTVAARRLRGSRRCSSSRLPAQRPRCGSAARPPMPGSAGSAGGSRQPARDATFAVDGPQVTVVPDRPGIQLDAVRAADAVLAAALRRIPARRVATLAVDDRAGEDHGREGAHDGDRRGRLERTRRIYGGVPNRIHNVELVAHLVDDKLIAPGDDVLVQQDDRRADGGQGLPRARR